MVTVRIKQNVLREASFVLYIHPREEELGELLGSQHAEEAHYIQILGEEQIDWIQRLDEADDPVYQR
jgi:hypothetical protein